jgi:hypothetical protein
MPASVRSDIIIENAKVNVRTTTAIQPRLIDVKRKRITGTKRTETAKNTTMSLARTLMRSKAKNWTAESSPFFKGFLDSRNF